MLTNVLLYRTLILLVLPTAVFGKRGGFDFDFGDGDSGDDDSGSGGPACGEPSSALESYDIQPDQAIESNSTDPGSFFQGEAFFHYKVPSDLLSAYGGGSGECSSEWKTLRMLGYAWVGPQMEYPKGFENPFVIGFKAWKSDKPVSEIHNAYSKISSEYCPADPALVRFLTTEGVDGKLVKLENDDDDGSTTYSNFAQRALDLFSVNASESKTDPEAVDFSAFYLEDANEEEDLSTPLHLLQLNKGYGSEQEWIEIGWSKDISVNGSITNTTLSLNIFGNTTMTVEESYNKDIDCDAAVNITFTGKLDRANSTEKPSIRQDNQPLVAFVSNGAGVISLNYAIGMVWILCIALFSGHIL